MKAAEQQDLAKRLYVSFAGSDRVLSDSFLAVVRASVYSAILGRQRPRDMDPIIRKAAKAAARALRRKAGR